MNYLITQLPAALGVVYYPMHEHSHCAEHAKHDLLFQKLETIRSLLRSCCHVQASRNDGNAAVRMHADAVLSVFGCAVSRKKKLLSKQAAGKKRMKVIHHTSLCKLA